MKFQELLINKWYSVSEVRAAGPVCDVKNHFHKLLLKVLPVTTFFVRNTGSVISFYILCLREVHIGAVAVM